MSLPWLPTATVLTLATPLGLSVTDTASLDEPGEAPAQLSTFDAVYETHFDFVWRNLRRLGVEDSAVDDAAHDVFLVVYRQFDKFDGRNYRSWLFAIAQRVAWHYRRALARRRTEPMLDEELRDPSATCPVESQEKREACALVQKILAQLSEERRSVFVLSELEQMSMPQIADILKIPLNTAYSRLRLARRDFSRLLLRHESATSRSAHD